MSLREFSDGIVELAQPALELLQQSRELRWALAGLVWLFLVYRLFGHGVGKRRGLAHLYDLLVVVVGSLIVWSFRFGR